MKLQTSEVTREFKVLVFVNKYVLIDRDFVLIWFFVHSWLYHNATVVKTIAHEDGSLDVTTILDNATRCKFEKHFRRKIVD